MRATNLTNNVINTYLLKQKIKQYLKFYKQSFILSLNYKLLSDGLVVRGYQLNI